MCDSHIGVLWYGNVRGKAICDHIARYHVVRVKQKRRSIRIRDANPRGSQLPAVDALGYNDPLGNPQLFGDHEPRITPRRRVTAPINPNVKVRYRQGLQSHRGQPNTARRIPLNRPDYVNHPGSAAEFHPHRFPPQCMRSYFRRNRSIRRRCRKLILTQVIYIIRRGPIRQRYFPGVPLCLLLLCPTTQIRLLIIFK